MIKRLVIKDCLGIEELALNPGKVNVISGGNEKGKTSILETIEKALFNTKRRAKFVRTGADKAYIELETDDGINIRRTVKEDEAGLDSGSVKVTRDGVPVKAPETYLKELFGITAKGGRDVFAFNPVDFMQKKDTEQTDILLALLPIMVTAAQAMEWFGEAPKVNYEKHGLQVLKALEEWFYEARREANSRVKAVEDECAAVAKRLPDNYQLANWESVNLGQLFEELNCARETNASIEDCKTALAQHSAAVEAINNKYTLKIKESEEKSAEELQGIKNDIDKQLSEITHQIEGINKQMEALQKQRDDLVVKADTLVKVSFEEKETALTQRAKDRIVTIEEQRARELKEQENKKSQAEFYIDVNRTIDLAPIKARCEEAEHMKSFIPLAKEVEGLQARLGVEQKTAERYDKCVETARFKPVELLSTVELPVKDLGIDGRGIVTIKGLPLSNLSTAQQVRVCLDIARVLAKDNPLKLICVDKVEHLDETVRAEFLAQIEADQDYQYFITVVTKGELKVEAR